MSSGLIVFFSVLVVAGLNKNHLSNDYYKSGLPQQ